MAGLPGINHLDAVQSDGSRQGNLPRHNPIEAITLGGIIRDAGRTIEESRDLL